MTPDELVEAVAKKLWELEAKKYVIAWEDESPKNRDAYLADARAIIPIVQEACAKVAEDHVMDDWSVEYSAESNAIARAIRNMGDGS